MSTFLAGAAAALILFPVIISVVYLVIMRKSGKAPVSIIGNAADVTTPFLFLAVYVVARVIFHERGTGYYIVGIAAVVAIIFAVIERIRYKEFRIRRVLKRVWRFYFLLLSLAYVILLIAGLIWNIIMYNS